MNIQDAVIKAMKLDACITLQEFKGGAKIQPTNGRENCIVMNADGSHPSKSGWQPTAEQLTREDWLVVN